MTARAPLDLATLHAPLGAVLTGVRDAFEGDPDAIEAVVADDVVWVDGDDELDGVDEVADHFLAHGGWRERFHVLDVEPVEPGRWAVTWVLWLRADATSHRRDGTAHVVLDDGRIASWRASASEREDGSLAPWGGV